MTLELILRYVHFVSIFAIVSSIASEHMLLKKELTPQELKRLSRVDSVYGIAAIFLLAAGLTLWLGSFGKPAEFYTHNWIFHLKLTLFVIIGLLSIYPTVFFIRSGKKKEPTVKVPPIIFWMIRLELLIIFIIPLLAGLMSRGTGLPNQLE